MTDLGDSAAAASVVLRIAVAVVSLLFGTPTSVCERICWTTSFETEARMVASNALALRINNIININNGPTILLEFMEDRFEVLLDDDGIGVCLFFDTAAAAAASFWNRFLLQLPCWTF